jgi:hypothetical protein
MYFILWLALIVAPDSVHPFQAHGAQKFDTKEACQAYVDKATPHMSDYIKGTLGAPLDTEIRVHGDCRPIGDPA